MNPEQALGLLAAITVNIHPNTQLVMKDENGEQIALGATDRRLHAQVEVAFQTLSQFIKDNTEESESAPIAE